MWMESCYLGNDVSGSLTQPAHISLVNFECATDLYLFNFSPSSLTTEGLTILVWLGV
jgi:hypothetical protein